MNADGAPYSLDGFLRFASGQTRSGTVSISVGFLDSEFDCLGSYLGGDVTATLGSANSDVWVHRARRELVAPAGSKSAVIRINLTKIEASGSLLASFDGVHLVEGNGFLFGDDLESDTLCRWSSSTP